MNSNDNENGINKGLKNFVPFSREIASDFRSGLIKRDELIIYFWLRLNANPYGISTTSFSDIANDVLKSKKQINYSNKLLISLKKKRYLYYAERTGRRGSFEVHFGDFILPTKKITSLDKFFDTDEVRGETNTTIKEQSEPEQNLDVVSQNLEELNTYKKSLYNSFSIDRTIRTSNNDNDNKNNISIPFKEGTKLSEFIPKNSDEQYCLDIATRLKEPNINFILSIYKKYGIEHLTNNWRTFQNEILKGKINNPRAYFNSLVSNTNNSRK